MRDHFARQQENSLQGYIKGQVPFFFTEVDHIFADDDARVVAENVDAAERSDGAFGGAAAVLGGTHIAFFEESPSGALGDGADRGLAFFNIDIENNNGGAHLGEAERNAAPDTRTGARDYSDLGFEGQQARGGFGD